MRIVVPFQAGGIIDTLARLLSEPLQRSLGQPFVIENRGGAGGNVGTAVVARAKGDPHTLLLGSSGPLAISPLIESNLGYDPEADFTPITILARTPLVLVVPAASPWRDLRSMMDSLRGLQRETLYPTPGLGSPQLLAGEAFSRRVGFPATPVHYTGSAPVVTAIVAGEMPFTFENLVLVSGQVRAGTLRALAVTSTERAPMLPDVPTAAEAGLPDFQAGGWYGLLGPADLPTGVVERLHAATVAALAEPHVARRITEMGSPNISSTPQEFRAMIAAETARWRGVLRPPEPPN
ncbi:Bug family tripartite tricarboxylate transporter substrate binding protein [Sabulicella glaciei]|uniref:Tripartite tricarboxylate transporter substrate binding protein n=1 Tax=Sabulicella glaciei TaxID=2984948 RepID=A0ABT3P1X2_9PROT|nr:tripartite tricarboxylate transporter substrate binding protein [Roseococcus sp. MDT2-1-1]